MIGIFVLGYWASSSSRSSTSTRPRAACGSCTPSSPRRRHRIRERHGQLKELLAEASDILLAASAIVEVVDAHQRFEVVTNLITTKAKQGLF